MARYLVWLIFTLISVQALALNSFTYQGRLFDSFGIEVNSGTVPLKIQILDPAGNCLLYEESHSLQMTDSEGFFSILVGLGTKNTTTAPSLAFSEVLSNQAVLSDAQMGCAGNQYTPSSSDHRILRAYVDGTRLDPDQVISPSPRAIYANESQSVGGKSLSQIESYSDTNFGGSPLPNLGSISTGQSVRWGAGGWELFTPGTPTGNATTSDDGLLSAVDKTKLDGIESGATGDQTAAEILAATKTVDGATSGLDADLLDGLSSSAFVQTELDPTVPASIKDGISWSEVTGKPSFADGNSLDASDGSPVDALVVDANGNVGVGTASPNSSAALEVSSTTKGFLPPRVTTTERDAISSPTEGLVVYNSTDQKLQFYDGSAWGDISSGGGGGGGGACTGASEELNNGTGGKTVGDCSSAGGNAINTSDGCVCKFTTGSSCPSGWTQVNNYTTTSPETCNGGGCGGSSCTTGVHGFSDASPETCTYRAGGASTCGPYNNQCCPPGSYYSCQANVVEIGCR